MGMPTLRNDLNGVTPQAPSLVDVPWRAVELLTLGIARIFSQQVPFKSEWPRQAVVQSTGHPTALQLLVDGAHLQWSTRVGSGKRRQHAQSSGHSN